MKKYDSIHYFNVMIFDIVLNLKLKNIQFHKTQRLQL